MAQLLDLEALSTTINGAINNSTNLTTIHGKAAFSYLARGIAKPKCLYVPVSDNLNSAYNTNLFPSVKLRFSIFADDLETAQTISAGLTLLFKNNLFTLGSGQKVMSKLSNGSGLLKEGDEDKEHIVYHLYLTFEFLFL